MYRFEGKARMMTIGPYPAVPLATARAKASKAKEQLIGGIDPGKEQIEAKSAERSASTIRDLANEYIEKWAKPRKRSWQEDERILFKDVVPLWGRRKAKDITRRDIVQLLDRIVDRGSPIQANRTLATIRKMFNFALNRSILDASPCMAITAPSKENRRERVLSEDEIKSFWFELDNARMAQGTKLALKLQLVTAQRKGEIASLEWTELDLKNKQWIIPGEKSKNELPHKVPLTKLAITVLKNAKEISGDSKWVFPSPRGNKHITGPGIDHAVRKNLDIFGVESFTPHDLRRTSGTMMTSFGVPRLTVAKILNHMESGITSIYDRHSYDKEKRKALEKWERKLDSILTGKSAKIIHIK